MFGGLHAKLADLFVTRNDRPNDAERAQATFRLGAATLFTIVMLSVFSSRGDTAFTTTQVVLSFSSYILVSALVLLWIVKRPGENLLRRAISMVSDYIAVGGIMTFGGAVLLPAYAPLLWVTVGYGLRFGSRYLIASTCMALASILVTAYCNPFWRENPYVTITLILTTVLVPAYAYSLLERVYAAFNAAREANVAKSRFLAQASHDLRQPIHAISLFTACLRDTGLDREQKQMVENIDRSLQSVSRLFRSLLDISTLDSGKVTPFFEPVALKDLFEDIVRQNSEAAQWAGVELRMVPTRAYVTIDAALITTILQNVVSNALKYAPGRPVLIGCRRRHGGLAIEVYDRGNGIAAHHLAKVFDEFYQVRERGDRDVDGVGLGLPIVKRLTQLMGLSAFLRSVPGRGTTVVIEGLRIASQTAAAKPKSEGPRPAIDGLRVLLVEDDEDVLLATATLLRKWGCVVDPQLSIPDEVSACDLIVTDFDLGAQVTGTECIKRVRNRLGHAVPAIVMTGHDENRVRDDLGDPEIAILAKPIRPAELRSIMTTEKLKIDRLAKERAGSR
ncbi:hybrid sensor histidine kinase/response regulator [Mesorhizobium retamae]|uniref:histidine kinase n=1 Tax=Mesorhizobium retamae TaxID=2912854 RepID=A0ABS9QDV4_9HYPH|nr:hybrid sensor histidine kinase/response regulator [Mesorhizobium sp. IRAMC:0171]MCG7505607.1 ATP-binding protein [Mesorhizobium sp. IRAMC:0171]